MVRRGAKRRGWCMEDGAAGVKIIMAVWWFVAGQWLNYGS